MSVQTLSQSSRAVDVKPGLADPVFDAQSIFRSAMLATAYPGRVVSIDRGISPPQPLAVATAALCLTLMDLDTPAWLDPQAASGDAPAWLRFHCGLSLAEETAAARFAIATDAAALPRLYHFHSGDIEYPDRSTTLIVQVPSLAEGPETVWTGPGIKGAIRVGIAGLPDWFWSDWDINNEDYPLGVDVLFTSRDAIIGLPRTIRVEV